MIDFRYHLVSIASIFIALAVGIVLGAGPLEGNIGDTLTEEVTQLRQDRDALRDELQAAQESESAREEFTGSAMRRLVDGAIPGRRLALVVLPGADADDVAAVQSTVQLAGATIVSRVSVNESWTDDGEDASQTTSALAQNWRATLELGEPGSGEGPLDGVLAATLMEPKDAVVASQLAGARAALAQAGLVDAASEASAAADSAIVVSAPITGGESADRERIAARLAALAASVDAAGAGAVLVSGTDPGDTDEQSSVVAAARSNQSIADRLSTVDHVNRNLGNVSMVYALVQQYAGEVGQYGIAPDVTAPFPPVPGS